MTKQQEIKEGIYNCLKKGCVVSYEGHHEEWLLFMTAQLLVYLRSQGVVITVHKWDDDEFPTTFVEPLIEETNEDNA